MDAFFGSVEQRDDPKLRKKPVALGGDPKGRIVVARLSAHAAPPVHEIDPIASGESVRLLPKSSSAIAVNERVRFDQALIQRFILRRNEHVLQQP